MAISYTSEVRDVVQEAFNLLRQDYTAPAVSDPAVTVDAVADTSLEWCKARLSLKTAANEVWDAFGWGGTLTAEGLSAWPYKMRNALVYTLARELAIPVAGRVEDMKVFASLAAEKIAEAKARALNDALDAVSDTETAEVIALVAESYAAGDGKRMPHSVTAVTARIAALKDTARRDILIAHDWNFACVSEEGASEERGCGPDGWRFAAPYPAKALRLVAVFGPRGDLAEWKVENGAILTREPVSKVRYVRDVGSVAKWPALAKPLYVMRLKALVARTVTGSAQEAAMHEQLYARALADAKLADARESNTPHDAWGGNFYADAMRGRAGGHGRLPPPFRR